MNAPGQEDKAARLPGNCLYPTMDQLADQIGAVCSYYEVNSESKYVNKRLFSLHVASVSSRIMINRGWKIAVY